MICQKIIAGGYLWTVGLVWEFRKAVLIMLHLTLLVYHVHEFLQF